MSSNVPFALFASNLPSSEAAVLNGTGSFGTSTDTTQFLYDVAKAYRSAQETYNTSLVTASGVQQVNVASPETYSPSAQIDSSGNRYMTSQITLTLRHPVDSENIDPNIVQF